MKRPTVDAELTEQDIVDAIKSLEQWDEMIMEARLKYGCHMARILCFDDVRARCPLYAKGECKGPFGSRVPAGEE